MPWGNCGLCCTSGMEEQVRREGANPGTKAVMIRVWYGEVDKFTGAPL